MFSHRHLQIYLQKLALPALLFFAISRHRDLPDASPVSRKISCVARDWTTHTVTRPIVIELPWKDLVSVFLIVIDNQPGCLFEGTTDSGV